MLYKKRLRHKVLNEQEDSLILGLPLLSCKQFLVLEAVLEILKNRADKSVLILHIYKNKKINKDENLYN